MASNVNNLNVFTFIKDIYQSLKHIDQSFSNVNESLTSRITKIEDTQNVIIDKLANIEILLSRIGETNRISHGINKNIEHELLEKMTKMNTINMSSSNYRVELKPEELTFANILENDYSLHDINLSLSRHKTNNSNSNYNSNDISNDNSNDISNAMNSSISSSSSGSSYYSNSNSNYTSISISNSNSNSNSSNYGNNNLSDGISGYSETLDSLLF